ncbi:MAG TPA: AAA family ATPase [Polyangia bacterium]|nr:AAA family ATPase [Polyangia bacterium]
MNSKPTTAPMAAPPLTDVRAVPRALGALLCALGRPTEAEVARANAGLQRLSLPAVTLRDLAQATPESLAPLVPLEARAGVLALMRQIAADQPIRARLALSYAQLWGMADGPAQAAGAPSPQPQAAGSVLRWVVGALPSHVTAPEEPPAPGASDGPYRGGDVRGPSPAPRASGPQAPTLRERVERIGAQFAAVRDAVEQVIIGKRDVIERVLCAMAARGHVLLVDVPGTGKTQLCKTLAAAIDLQFSRVQMTPDLLPLDVTGASVWDPRDKRFVFRPGPVFTNLLLADEINRATPKTQSALLEVMEERSVTVDGTTHVLPPPFQVLATMNPLDHQGTYALPAAQIDRFMVMLEVGYPSADDEVRILDRHLGAESALAGVTAVIGRDDLVDWQATVPLIHVAPAVKRAAVEWVHALRAESPDRPSVSPRATLAWVRLGQARALALGREFVTTDDLVEVAPDVLRHRLWSDGESVRDRLRAAARTVGSAA